MAHLGGTILKGSISPGIYWLAKIITFKILISNRFFIQFVAYLGAKALKGNTYLAIY